MKSAHFVFIAVFTFILDPAIFAQTLVRYVPPENENDKRHTYTYTLLREALEITKVKYGTYDLTAGPRLSPQQSVLRLKNGKDIDIIVSMTSNQYEAMFTPVRIPLFRGMIGDRLLMIHRKHELFFKNLKADDLKKVTLVQGVMWPDTRILKANGYNVIGGDIYGSLFPMLENDEPRAFPRAVHEIWEELDRYPQFVIAPNLYFNYPAALYFFTRKEQPELARRIEDGLLMLIESGRFEKLFIEYIGDKLEKAALGEREMVRLSNPELPAATPLNDKKLWRAARND